ANQTICHGAVPAMLHATPPAGGSGIYVYQWQSGYTISSFFDVFLEMSLGYQPGPVNQTTYYRLRQVDTQFHDTVYTNIVTIAVNPPMAAGSTGDFQVIGYNTVPLPVHSLPATGGSGNFTYQWKYHECDCGPLPCDSLVCGPGCTGSPWLLIPGATNLVYQPGVLTHGKCYRMYATDVSCNQTVGSGYVHIYVSPQLVPGTAVANQTICHGAVPAMLHATPPAGGSGIYVYQWQSGYTISSFFDVFMEISCDYQPGQVNQTTYYRLRQVDTQFHDTVYTNVLTVGMLPLVVAGFAGPNQAIPYNTQPGLLTSTPPANGCGSFSYQWQSGITINSFFDVFMEISLSYQPGPLTQTNCYRLRQVDNIGHDTVYTNMVTITVTPWNCGSLLTDTRDGKVYPTVQIAAQCWMKQNLNIGTMIGGTQNQLNNQVIEKYCYNNLEANCNIYGGLYQWDEYMNYTPSGTAVPSGRQGLCPDGWHIPSDAEWCLMETFLDATVNCSGIAWIGTDAGGKMKEAGTSHWASPNAGATNSSGFTALPGGNRTVAAAFVNMASITYYWTSAETSGTFAMGRSLYNYNAPAYRHDDNKRNGFSGRCLKD
ncbi:MAG: hypothetical protein NT040_10835, partial [Bacteroidetes bacterium]|nr:hypothetical protein [Bacteroidota bacterium]